MSSLKPGYIIKILDSDQGSSGVIVSVSMENLIYFKFNHHQEPTFAGIDDWQRYQIKKTGQINQHEYSELKKALHKYYHQHKGSPDEVGILADVMDFAYPNGIPALPAHQRNLHLEVHSNEESQFLDTGCQIKLKCPRSSSISFLNDQVLDIVDTYAKGLRVLRRGASTDSNKYYTLFFRRPGEDNSLAGVEEVEVISNQKQHFDRQPELQSQLTEIRKRDSEGNLNKLTQIMDGDGQIYHVHPTTMAVNSLNDKLTGKYQAATDEIILDQPNPDQPLPDLEDEDEAILESVQNLRRDRGDFNMAQDIVLADLGLEDELDREEDEEEIENFEDKFGGARRLMDDTDSSEIEISDINFESLEQESEELESFNSKLSMLESDDYLDADESEGEELDFEEFDVIDQPIELSKVVYRSKKVPIPDEKKIYEPKIQKSEFYKYLVEKLIPNKQLRKNSFLVNQIHHVNNLINQLKDKATEQHESGNPFNEDRRPLVDQYMNNDYRSRFLIPVVLDRKKLYFKSDDSDYHFDFYQKNSNILHQNYLQVISDLITRVDQKNSSKISSLTYFQLEKAINDMMSPFKINDDSKLVGDIGRIADGVSDLDLPFNNYNTLAVRYSKNPFKNQGIDFQESEIESYSMQSPLIYYQESIKKKSDAELDQEEDELIAEDPDKEWVYEENMETSLDNIPKFKRVQDGDRFNSVGYLALPFRHAFNPSQMNHDSISGLYEEYQEDGIREKTLDKDYVSKKVLKYRNKPTFFYFPESAPVDSMEKERHLKTLVPSFPEICRQHQSELVKCENWTQLEVVISPYGYKLRELNQADWEILREILADSVENQSFHLSKRWLEYQKFLLHESSSENKNVRHCPLVDKMILEELEIYYDTYPLLNETIDNDTTRLAWTLQKPDHGKLLELLLTRNQLVEDEKTLNIGNIDKELVKVQKDLDILEGRYQRELKLTNYFDSKDAKKCGERPKYNVAKVYHDQTDLEADNYKTAKSTVGNVEVVPGDYAVLKGRKVFLRIELPNQRHVWEESSLKVGQLEELVKKECQSPGLDHVADLVSGKDCQFQSDDFKCWPGHLDRIYRQIGHNKELLTTLNKERDQVNKFKTKRNSLEKAISKARSHLRSQRNLERLKRENKLAAYQQIIEDVKKAQLHKQDCAHYQVINYFFRMKHITLKEKYMLSHTILQKFQDLTPNFLKYLNNGEETDSDDIDFADYGRYDALNKDDNLNWTYCNICHQKLICNHYLYAHHIVQQTGDLNEKLLKDLYGLEVDQNYNCRVCGEHLVTGEEIDMDGFVKKADKNDQRLITREVLDQAAERQEVQRNILDELLDDVENKNDQSSTDMKLFLNTLQSLKSLVKVDLLSQDQEDIISFIKSEPFLTREYFREYLRKSLQIANPQLLEYQANQFFNRFAIYDITARFLITLQTSDIIYSLSNDLCRGHLGGFPLGPLHDLTTVKYFSCLLEKMGSIPEWNFLLKEKNIEARFIGRLKLMSQTQKIQQLYNRAIEKKATHIFHEDPFLANPTNSWMEYRPSLGVLDTKWTPKHSLNPNSVHKVITKKYTSFASDLRTNLNYKSTKLFDSASSIISQENPAVTFHKTVKLGNSCCLTKIKPGDGGSYYQYLFQKEPNLEKLVAELAALDKLKLKLERQVGRVGPPPSFMKVDMIYQFDPYYHLNQETKLGSDMKTKLFETYVQMGLNRGAPRIFNAFDICTLSGESKPEILGTEYTDQDYHQLVHDIRKNGEVSIVQPAELSHRDILIQSIQNWMAKSPEIKSGDFLDGFLIKLIGLLNEDEIKIKDLNKHWNKLDQQINHEVSTLAQHLDVLKKDTQMKEKLHRLGDYRNLYQQEDIANIDFAPKEQQGDLFKSATNTRYMRFERNLKHYIFNFFRPTLAKIKNNAFDSYQMAEINEQWKDLVQFKQNRKLFKEAFRIFKGLTNGLEQLKGSEYKHFTFSNSSSLFKCILLIILNRMIDSQPEKKGSTEYSFVVKNDQGEPDLDLDLEGTRNLDEDIRNFNLQKFSDQKVMILYIDIILAKIMREEETFDRLTQSYMTIVADAAKEERNRKNLKLIAHLATEGRKDLRKVIMDQKRLGLIDYEDFADILQKDIEAGEDQPIFDRDMEVLDQLGENPDVAGHLIEEKRQDKMMEYEIEENEYSYVAGEEDDFEEF